MVRHQRPPPPLLRSAGRQAQLVDVAIGVRRRHVVEARRVVVRVALLVVLDVAVVIDAAVVPDLVRKGTRATDEMRHPEVAGLLRSTARILGRGSAHNQVNQIGRVLLPPSVHSVEAIVFFFDETFERLEDDGIVLTFRALRVGDFLPQHQIQPVLNVAPQVRPVRVGHPHLDSRR